MLWISAECTQTCQESSQAGQHPTPGPGMTPVSVTDLSPALNWPKGTNRTLSSPRDTHSLWQPLITMMSPHSHLFHYVTSLCSSIKRRNHCQLSRITFPDVHTSQLTKTKPRLHETKRRWVMKWDLSMLDLHCPGCLWNDGMEVGY